MKIRRKHPYLWAALAISLSCWSAIFAIISLYWSATAVITFTVISAWLGVVAIIEARDARSEPDRDEEQNETSTQQTP
jgi:apolipoprotein N-acyltransferase